LKNEEVGICVLTQMALLKVLGTLYFACLPQAGTLYNEVLLLVSRFLLLILISNAELRLMNEEVGIRVLTQMALLKVLGTLYFACLPQAGTWYNEVLLLDTNYLILFFFERRLKNEEVGICVLTQMALLKVLGTLYLEQ
jgi:hypothetical protein